MDGRFITLEGIDGAGKSTHLPRVARCLEARGMRVTVTREPGGTELGERLRELLLGGRTRLHPETETLLMFAARRQHVEEVIIPALAAGNWVVCDRFTDATYAYQSGGSGVAWEKIALLEQWAHGGLQPGLTLLFDIDPGAARGRAAGQRAADRFEREEKEFHERVRKAYLRRARQSAGRIRVIDGGQPLEQVGREVDACIEEYCSRMEGRSG